MSGSPVTYKINIKNIVAKPTTMWVQYAVPVGSYVVSHLLLGRVELFVVRPPTRFVNESSRDATHEQTVVDPELDH